MKRKTFMEEKEDLQYFMSLEYNAILRSTNNRHYLYIPELSVLAEGQTIEETYGNLEREKESYFRRMIDLGFQKEIGRPLSVKIRKTFGKDLSFFLIKIAAATICLIVVLNFLFIRAERFIETNSMDKIIGRSWKVETLVSIVNQKLSEIPEDGKERIRMQLKNIAEQIKPDVDEIMTVWEEKTTLKESGQTKGKK